MNLDLIVPTSREDIQKWGNDILDQVSKYSHSKQWNLIRYNYEANFLKYLGELNVKDFEYIHSSLGRSKPMKVLNFPLLEPLIQRMVGEFTSKPIPYRINRINKNAYSEKMQLMSVLAAEKLMSPYFKRAEKELGMKLPIEQKMQYVPEQFRDMPHKSIRDALEINLQYGLNYLYYTYDFQDTFARNFYDTLINNDMMGRIVMIGNDPVIQHIPIQNAIFQLGEDNYLFDKIHRRSPFMGQDVWMTFGAFLQQYGHRLNKKNRKLLQESEDQIKNNPDVINQWNNDFGYWYQSDIDGGTAMIRVVDIEVNAMSEKKFLTEPYSKSREEIYFNSNVNEWWELVRAGKDIYLDPRRKKNQIPRKGDFTELQSSYFGMVSRHSFITKAWPVQNLYNVGMWTLEFLQNIAGGKATRYATERKPDGYEYEEIAWMGHVLGLIPEQVRVGDVPGRSVAMGEIDFGPSASIQYIIQLTELMKRTAEAMTGVPQASRGQSPGTAPVGTAQLNINQAAYTTKPLYDVMTRFCETGLQRCADIIRYSWQGDEEKSYIGGDGMPVVFKVSKDVSLQEVGIYAQSSVQQNMEKEYILQQMEKVLATDPTMILEVVKCFNAESPAEAEGILERGIQALRQVQQQVEKQKIEIGQKANELKAKEIDQKDQELKIKATVPLEVANTQKKSAISVAMINNEGDLNTTMEENEGAINQQHVADNNKARHMMLESAMAQDQEEEAPAEQEA